MRILVTLVAALALVGGTAGPTLGIDVQRVENLLVGIFEDVGSILNSFAGGPNDPSSPVTNAATRQRDAGRLDAATRKATDLANELNKLHR